MYRYKKSHDKFQLRVGRFCYREGKNMSNLVPIVFVFEFIGNWCFVFRVSFSSYLTNKGVALVIKRQKFRVFEDISKVYSTLVTVFLLVTFHFQVRKNGQFPIFQFRISTIHYPLSTIYYLLSNIQPGVCFVS